MSVAKMNEFAIQKMVLKLATLRTGSGASTAKTYTDNLGHIVNDFVCNQLANLQCTEVSFVFCENLPTNMKLELD